jgi:hypothetical protein
MVKLQSQGGPTVMHYTGQALEAGEKGILVGADALQPMPPLRTDRAGFGDDQPRSSLRPFLQKGGDPIVGRSILIGEIIIQGGHDNSVF